jgi:hypothetical protein
MNERPLLFQMVISKQGSVRHVYEEGIDLRPLGSPQIERGSHVEPTTEGTWTADMSPVGGPLLGPFSKRSEALAAERAWLETHWLVG